MSSISLKDLPSDILVKELLPRLDLPSAFSFSISWKSLNATVSSSSISSLFIKRGKRKDGSDEEKDLQVQPVLVDLVGSMLYFGYESLISEFVTIFRKKISYLEDKAYNKVLSQALLRGNFDLFLSVQGKRFFDRRANPFSDVIFSALGRAGDIGQIRKYFSQYKILDSDTVFVEKIWKAAAMEGKLEVLQQLAPIPSGAYPREVLYAALGGGQLEVLQWLVSRDWDDVASIAHLLMSLTVSSPHPTKILEYLYSLCKQKKEKGGGDEGDGEGEMAKLPLNLTTACAKSGNFHAFEWAVKHGAPFQEIEIFTQALMYGHVHFLEKFVAKYPDSVKAVTDDKQYIMRHAVGSMDKKTIRFALTKLNLKWQADYLVVFNHEFLGTEEHYDLFKYLQKKKLKIDPGEAYRRRRRRGSDDEEEEREPSFYGRINPRLKITRQVIQFFEEMGLQPCGEDITYMPWRIDPSGWKYVEDSFGRYVDGSLMRSATGNGRRFLLEALCERFPDDVHSQLGSLITHLISSDQIDALDFLLDKFPELFNFESLVQGLQAKPIYGQEGSPVPSWRGLEWLLDNEKAKEKLMTNEGGGGKEKRWTVDFWKLGKERRFDRNYFLILEERGLAPPPDSR